MKLRLLYLIPFFIILFVIGFIAYLMIRTTFLILDVYIRHEEDPLI